MTNNIKFGFFKNKFDAGSTSTTLSYPAYPEMPTAENFNTFVNLGYVSQGGPVANIDTVKGNVIGDTGSINTNSISSYSLPKGNVLLYALESLSGNTVPHVYIYDFINKTLTDETPIGMANATTDFVVGSKALDNNIYFYGKTNTPINPNYAQIRGIDIDTYVNVGNVTNGVANVWGGNITYPGASQAITLIDGNVLIAPSFSNNSNFTLHVTQSITTDDHGLGGGNVTFQQGYLVASTIKMDPSNSGTFHNMCQDPVTGVVYIIPGHGFKANSNVSETKRSIGVYNPSSNVALRISPANINLDDSGSGIDSDTLYQGCAYGVDKNIYAFPGQVKKDILVFNPATQDGVQNTFGIFNTVGGNTITCSKNAILATDGNIYVRARGTQPDYFSGEANFYLSIDTKPDSATYQQGTIFLVEPGNTSYDRNPPNSYSIAGDNLILGPGFSDGAPFETIQISAPTGFNQVSAHPVLNQNNKVT